MWIHVQSCTRWQQPSSGDPLSHSISRASSSTAHSTGFPVNSKSGRIWQVTSSLPQIIAYGPEVMEITPDHLQPAEVQLMSSVPSYTSLRMQEHVQLQVPPNCSQQAMHCGQAVHSRYCLQGTCAIWFA